jgi:uncharacterized protein YndB with AHSA1/START domain
MAKLDLTVVPGKYDLTIRRTFDAPRDLVFKTWMNPDNIPNFWGPAYLKTTVEVMEVRQGGRWRFLQREPNGAEYGFHGVYHDIVPSERVVQTFEFEGMPGHVSLETMTLEEVDGKTNVTLHSVFQSIEDRDGMVDAGMEGGATEMLDRFAELVEKARVG